MQAGRGDNDAAATRQETAAAVPGMRPPWNNWFMITYEQTIEKERVGLPRAYPRVRKGYYTPLQVARKGTPRSTYQAFCDDVSPRPRRPRPPSDEELVAEAVARRPLSARHRRTAPLSADPPTITPLSARQPITPRPILVPRRKFDPINPDESTYQAEYSRHFIPQPPSAREKGDPAGISYPRHDGTALCLDPSVEATRKIRMLRAQVAIEREARREAKRDLKDMLAAKEIAPYLPYRSRMTTVGPSR